MKQTLHMNGCEAVGAVCPIVLFRLYFGLFWLLFYFYEPAGFAGGRLAAGLSGAQFVHPAGSTSHESVYFREEKKTNTLK